MRNRWCRRPETTRADFGTRNVAGFAILLFAIGLSLNSRKFACQLLETLGHRHILQTRRQPWGRASDYRILATRGGVRNRAVRAVFNDFGGTPCVTRFRQTKRQPTPRRWSQGTMRHLLSQTADAIIPPNSGRTLRRDSCWSLRVVGHSLRGDEYEKRDQLHRHLAASMRLGRLSVRAGEEHEEVKDSGVIITVKETTSLVGINNSDGIHLNE